MTPFLKWAGGKRRLAPELLRRLPDDFGRLAYAEPFAGSAALYFALPEPPLRVLLNDTCRPLMNAYVWLRANPLGLIERTRSLLRSYPTNYYRVRDRFNAGPALGIKAAAEFLYLNAACFNGIYRENARGAFNVPVGRPARGGKPKLDTAALRLCAARLRGAQLSAEDFLIASKPSLEPWRRFYYFDPPYAPLEGTSFSSYSAEGFRHDDHIRLRDFVRALTRRGDRVMLSNADTLFVRDIYREFRVESLRAPRSISCTGKSRGAGARELIIRNY